MRIPCKKAGYISLKAGLLALIVLCCACSKIEYTFPREAASAVAYPDVKFAVISDVHIYDPSLGTTGEAFEKAMESDRKLLRDGIDLLDFATGAILDSGVSFVLVSGDLTKDGELINHQLLAEKLNRFTDADIPVYVVPGNHDINNPWAYRYDGDDTAPVPTVSADEFAQIYGKFGFDGSVMRDADSLSYVAEPVPGLWLLAIDSCRYRENTEGEEPLVSGSIGQKTMNWIAGVLSEAAEKGKAVIAMMHHGVVEHWKGQAKLHPDYLVNDFKNFQAFLASWNVRLVFTGHYHAQDIARADYGGKFIYDVETGSLITAPCPIRYAEIKNNTIQIRTDTIVDKVHPGTDFAANAHAFVKKTVVMEAFKTLKKYLTTDEGAAYIADGVGDAFNAHYAGDEDPALRPAWDKTKLGLWSRFIYGWQDYVMDGLWNDPLPADNNVHLEL